MTTIAPDPSAGPGSPRLQPLVKRLGAAFFLAVVAVLLISGDEMHDSLLAVLEVARRLAEGHRPLAAVVVVLFAAMSAMLAFVSTSVIVPFVVYTWSPGTALFLFWSGWLLGGICAYSVGRFLGRPMIQSLVPAETLERYERRLPQRLSFGMVVLIQLALPSEIPGYLLGLARHPFLRYLGALGLAEFPYALATVYIGLGLVARQLPMLIGVGAAALALGAYALHRLHRHLAPG